MPTLSAVLSPVATSLAGDGDLLADVDFRRLVVQGGDGGLLHHVEAIGRFQRVEEDIEVLPICP